MYQISLKKIYEHDMDLLIMEEFVSDRGFARIFLDKVSLSEDYAVEAVSHSLADADGESDITVILRYPDKRVALLIEDKIDAQTMPEQSERYQRRAQKAVLRGDYDLPYVLLVAPADYHREHKDDTNAVYEYRVCYEELRDYLSKQSSERALFKTAIIDCALREKSAGYQVQEIPAVTEFWIKLRQFCAKEYPQLDMLGENSPKGASACWPEFRTALGKAKVIYKAQKGHIDLEFPAYGDRVAELLAVIGDKMSPAMQIWKTGKSASVRLADERWALDFSRKFEDCQPIVSEVLQAISILCEFATMLNYSELY